MMRKTACVVFMVMLLCSGSYGVHAAQSTGRWVQSRQGNRSINHLQDWMVEWSDQTVTVTHPQTPLINCTVSMFEWQGTAQQYVEAAVDHIRGNVQQLRIINAYAVSRNPDTYGVRLLYAIKGQTIGFLILASTSNGRHFCVRSYVATIAEYDEAKLVMIPILLSLRYEQPKKAGGSKVSAGTQLARGIRSPQGYWQFKTPFAYLKKCPSKK